jgi:ribonuclease HI
MEIVHFAVIYPLLQDLRKWLGKVTLVKVKSHTGCLLNECADELAEHGRQAEGPEICPLTLRVSVLSLERLERQPTIKCVM